MYFLSSQQDNTASNAIETSKITALKVSGTKSKMTVNNPVGALD